MTDLNLSITLLEDELAFVKTKYIKLHTANKDLRAEIDQYERELRRLKALNTGVDGRTLCKSCLSEAGPE
jgi:chromosome segregation ATPase